MFFSVIIFNMFLFSNTHLYFVTQHSLFPSFSLTLPFLHFPPPSSSFFFATVGVCSSWHRSRSLFDVVSRSPELQSLATLSVIGRPAVSLVSIDSF